jgi:ribose-phosphate pyrophosphokinase
MIHVNGALIEQHHFGAGELNIKLFGCGQETMRILWNYESDEEIFTLACIRCHYANSRCILTMPYLPHARMDRVKNPEDVFTLRTFASFINGLHFDEVRVLDAHSNVGIALIERCINESPKNHIQRAIDKLGYPKEHLCLFFPDEGAQKRYGEMFPDYPQAFGIKKRNWETRKIEGYMIVGEENVKNKEILIIDDICSYGNTFIHAADALHKAGATDVNLYITHCEESINKGNVFTCGMIDNVFTTDSLIRSDECEDKLRIV